MKWSMVFVIFKNNLCFKLKQFTVISVTAKKDDKIYTKAFIKILNFQRNYNKAEFDLKQYRPFNFVS